MTMYRRHETVYEFLKSWDIDSIGESISTAKGKNAIPDFPLDKIEIQPTAHCQFDCPWCFGRYIKPKKRVELPFAVIDKNILTGLPTKPVIMLAGLYSEPLLHTEIGKIISRIGELGLRFGLYTNGFSLNDEISRVIVEAASKVESSKPSFISFDVSTALYYKKFDELVEKVKRLIELKGDTPFQINAPILVTDGQRLKPIQEKLFTIGADNVKYSVPIVPVDPEQQKMFNAINRISELNPEHVYIEIYGKPFNRCFAMSLAVSINAEGKVFPCSQTSAPCFDNLSIGSVYEKHLLEIWHGREHIERFQNFDPRTSMCRCNLVDGEFNRLCAKFWR